MESPRVTNKQDTSFISSVHEDLVSLRFPGKVTNNTQAAGKQLLLVCDGGPDVYLENKGSVGGVQD